MNTKPKRAFITGATGQDGSYLTELLLDKGYEVHALVRRTSAPLRAAIPHIPAECFKSGRLFAHYGDLTDGGLLKRLIRDIAPDEVYNLGAQSHVRVSFDMPEHTMEVTGLGALRVLEAIRDSELPIKFYQASSSEMFGVVKESPQNEKTVFNPQSPYALAKVFAHNLTRNYRDAYGLFACNGICFNHESPRRGADFVTRKITIGVAEILAGKRDKIELGNLDAKRDWGYAPEYCEAMWLMLQRDKPDDYVVATGETHSIREFLDEAFGLVGIKNWKKHVEINQRHFRPAEVHVLAGDASKARRALGWKSRTSFKDLVRTMLEADCRRLGVNNL